MTSSLSLQSVVEEMTASGDGERLRMKFVGRRSDAARVLRVDPATVFRWEKGLNRPTGDRLTTYGRWLQRLAKLDEAQR